jgi:hypothetical protein
LPAEHGQAWHKTQDAFGAQLWDIEPSVQVAGIGVYDENVCDPSEELFEREFFLKAADEDTEISDPGDGAVDKGEGSMPNYQKPSDTAHSELREDDVVILDGCYAATVFWDKFRPVWHAKKLSFKRKVLKWVLRVNFIPFLIGIILAAFSRPLQPVDSFMAASMRQPRQSNPIEVAAAIFLVYSFGIYVAGPFIIRTVYGGKFWDTQPWFFGFEGYLPIEEIEAKIFGLRKGRLMWSPYASSTLSHHEIKDNRWVIPRDPTEDPETARLVERAKNAKPGDMRVGN